MRTRHMVVAITGASGTIYGLRLVSELLRQGVRVSLVVSDAGFEVLREENGLSFGGDEAEISHQFREHYRAPESSLAYYDCGNFRAPFASGSAAVDAMIVCPCTMGTLARIASGHSGNLLERCADVMLKERRPLVLVPRETPLSVIHLENMLAVSRAGAQVVPAMPAFYHLPQSLDDLVAFVVAKLLDLLAIEQTLIRRWGESEMKDTAAKPSEKQ